MIDPELLPPNWPKQVKYLIDYEYHPAISPSVLGLVQGRRRKKSEQHKDPGTMSTLTQWPQAHSVEDVQEVCEKNNDDTDEDEPDNEDRSWDEAEDEPNNEDGSRDEGEDEYDNLPIGHAISGLLRSRLQSTTNDNNDSSIVPLPPYEIRLIDSPLTHPVLGSYGLFATEPLRPGRHLLDYISLIVPDEYADPESDHTLYLCNDLNLDASAQGNHGRFVNDFRRIRTQQQGPNVAWDLYRDADTGEVRMGCKVLKRIQPGEEILCTYGKAYWKSRGIPVSGNEWEDTWDTDLEDWSENEVEQDKQAQQPK
ncbi:hypothetical protein BC939DRAFT_479343 [Gamsiella multidivaricata]|uniref:uncharacterized protein n=1 Tax=Gamsiella multidivaricata TaxID=101098 RepID=UPI00221FB35A|nr:uncharacterized protein BC939DRAFT_479343 [Gamsiella multidivaricata]KAG0365887.1 hypothetical protein BGZ54_006089 [Gamsiella multidivaricata]KAI7819823.1 hypothetical protein BC939DRAFT_479343 [Gamsiella multidivaricata]